MQPGSESDLAEVIRGTKGPLRVRGGGTRPVGKPVTGEALSVAGLSGIDLYEPGALTIVVKAGTPLAEVEQALAAEGQRLPFEPMDHRGLLGSDGAPTIGGVVAANASGPRRIQAGACRDSLIGVRFVTGEGEIVKNGGRVMKNVTGYDLVKLMAGSYGTLGVLSEVSFKVLPAPDAAATLTIAGLDTAQAVRALSASLGSPFEVSGAAHLPATDGEARTLVRVEGLEAQVSYRTGKLTDLLRSYGPISVETDPAQVARTWMQIRDVAPFAGVPGDVWRISVKPSDGPGTAARTGGQVMLDWGGGLIWALVPEGTDMRARLGAFGGHATLVRASEDTRAAQAVFHPEPAPLAAISAGLRARFDPRGILNPGLMA
ncbi:FAD-binding protein [Tropicimonas sp. S265A]|uniref:FAD-binding protein n=1 Tax=Tropicimonas sp. S265A TaxID=3415134 RepID=UPI003C79944C